jgi:Protein of unknown function (DUF3606)
LPVVSHGQHLLTFVFRRFTEPRQLAARCAMEREEQMAKAKKQTARGRKQDRARVAAGQNYEMRYEAKKTGRSRPAVKKAVKKVGNSRKRVEKRLGR